MAFNDRLREARIASGLTQKQLAAKLGIAGTTVTGYEKGNSEPNVNTIGKIMEALHVDANFLWQDEMKELSTKDFTVPEIKMVKKYRDLDDHGKKLIDFVLKEESDRCESEYMELVARGGKYKVKKADVIELANRINSEPYEEDHDLC